MAAIASINANYSKPVAVNGYECWNCKQVAEAKKGIDPQNPKAGPYGIDTKNGSVSSNPASQQSSVTFGGALSGLNQSSSAPIPASAAAISQPGNQLSLSA